MKINPMKSILHFIPLLFFYLIVTVFLNKNELVGDEGRYLMFAQNLLDGYYAVPGLKPGFLWNGPGYPLILAPFLKLKAGFLVLRVLNAFFLFVGVFALFKSLSLIITFKKALTLAYAGGLTHYYFIYATTKILTEALAFGLISLCLYFFLRFYQEQRKVHLLGFSFFGGFLILTKVIFAYIFLGVLVVGIFSWFIQGFSKKGMKYIFLGILPIIVCLPYIVYTYNITGKYFYWGDSGGSSLYAMSSPFEDEYGSWFSTSPKGFFGSYPVHVKNHSEFIQSLGSLAENGVAYDEALKKKAIENIKAHPRKYIENVILNFSRLFTPYIYTDGSMYVDWFKVPQLFLGALIFWVWIGAGVIILIFFRNTYYLPILLFVVVAIGGMSLLSAYQRFLFPLYPLLIFLSSVFLVKFKISIEQE